ncbi:MAG: Crp/Fnr family transcriptional regulator [Bacteroidota bacterium]
MQEFLSKYINFSEKEYDSFMSMAAVKKYGKNEYLLNADRPVQKLFFVKSGLMRGYRIQEGIDVTHHFYVENWLATDYESYLTGNCGELYIQALVDTTVYEFDKTNLYAFFGSHEKFEKLRFIQAEDAYLQMVRRLKSFQCMELKERYLELVNKNPEIFDLVPQRQIASYLGVTPQSLSRVKSELSWPC